MKEKITLLDSTLEIRFDENQTDEFMLELIEKRVTDLMSQSPDLLFSYLYRLDIEEPKIKAALNNSDDIAPNLALSILILERQKQRIESKKKYKQDPIEGWEF